MLNLTNVVKFSRRKTIVCQKKGNTVSGHAGVYNLKLRVS